MWTALPNWNDLTNNPETVLNECVQKLWPQLRDRAVRRHGLTEQDAEDVVQETFLALVKEARQPSHKSPLPFWLARVFYFKVMDVRRNRCRKPTESLDKLIAETGDIFAGSDSKSWDQADKEMTCDWLQREFKLSELESALVVEHSIEGRTSEELAERYGHLLHGRGEPDPGHSTSPEALKRQAGQIRVLIFRSLRKIRERWRE